MTSKIIIPVSDFAAIVTRLEKVEAELAEKRATSLYQYGPCLRCGYGPWESFRTSPPRCCPRCHSAYWDTEPRKKHSRSPEDPPNPKWTTPKLSPRERAREALAKTPTVVVPNPPTVAKPPVILPPELRPPGEELIPPPPVPLADVIAASPKPPSLSEQLAERVTPVVHVAPMPDTIVERILANPNEHVSVDDIREAREKVNAGLDSYDHVAREAGDGDATTNSSGPESAPVSTGDSAEGRARPTDPNLQAKKDAFFADAIASGLASAPVTPPQPDAQPFVAPSLGETVADKVTDDDPFWK